MVGALEHAPDRYHRIKDGHRRQAHADATFVAHAVPGGPRTTRVLAPLPSIRFPRSALRSDVRVDILSTGAYLPTSRAAPQPPTDRIMTTQLLPTFIREHYEIHEWRHACAILKEDFPDEWRDVVSLLKEFRLKKSWITRPGGSKSRVAEFVDRFLHDRGWREKDFRTQVVVDDKTMDAPTHKIDCFRNAIALEIEWNNKDPFFDRDLNNFRLLFDLRAISIGIIVTRCDDLQDVFNELGRGKSYGASTTHMSKLLPKIEGGGGGGCPLLVFGISKLLYKEDE